VSTHRVRVPMCVRGAGMNKGSDQNLKPRAAARVTVVKSKTPNATATECRSFKFDPGLLKPEPHPCHLIPWYETNKHRTSN
jgi:hypothetical protein